MAAQTSLLVKASGENQTSCTWTGLKTSPASLTEPLSSVQEWQLNLSSPPTLKLQKKAVWMLW